MRVRGVDPSEYVKPKKSPEHQQARENFRKTIENLKTDVKGQENQEDRLTRDRIEDAINELNKTMEAQKTHLRFQMDEEAEKWQVSVINSKTDEVIRKIPPDKVLDMAAYIKEMLGLLVDEFV